MPEICAPPPPYHLSHTRPKRSFKALKNVQYQPWMRLWSLQDQMAICGTDGAIIVLMLRRGKSLVARYWFFLSPVASQIANATALRIIGYNNFEKVSVSSVKFNS